jgi:hypothetical protein
MDEGPRTYSGNTGGVEVVGDTARAAYHIWIGQRWQWLRDSHVLQHDWVM